MGHTRWLHNISSVACRQSQVVHWEHGDAFNWWQRIRKGQLFIYLTRSISYNIFCNNTFVHLIFLVIYFLSAFFHCQVVLHPTPNTPKAPDWYQMLVPKNSPDQQVSVEIHSFFLIAEFTRSYISCSSIEKYFIFVSNSNLKKSELWLILCEYL